MIPPVASLEAPLQREKRERTERENRERKEREKREKRERTEREQREKREKRERKDREKREKREKRERTEREKRENRERKDREKRAERESRKRAEREQRESRERGMWFQSPPRPPPHPSPPSGGAHQPLGSTCGSGLEIIRKGGPRGTTLWWLFFKKYIFFKTPPLCPPPAPSYLLLKGLGALTRLPSTGFPLLALAWCCLWALASTSTRFLVLLLALSWLMWWTSSPWANLRLRQSCHNCLCQSTLPPPGNLRNKYPCGCWCQGITSIRPSASSFQGQ